MPGAGPASSRPLFAADAKGYACAAIRDGSPVIFLENEILYGRSLPVPKLDDFVLPIGKARICRPGKDVTIVAYSITVGQALEAAEKLAQEGIDAEVIDLRSLRPLIMDTVIASVKRPTASSPWNRPGRSARSVRNFRPGGGAGVRLFRRTAAEGIGQGRADALCRQPRKAGLADGRRPDRGGQNRQLQGNKPVEM